MDWPTMERVLGAARLIHPGLVDITGGAPELNPNLRRFILALGEEGIPAQVRTNLTVLLEPGQEDTPAFFRANGVRLVASMPCYLSENVEAQRGEGVYDRSVEAIRLLNGLGYGVDADLPLNLVYNPGGPTLPAPQEQLEADYRRELGERFDIRFTNLLTITNMPIGRFRTQLKTENRLSEYVQLLREAFNPRTVEGVMCRTQLSVAWDGTLYDCDFNLALGMPVDHGAPDHIRDFSPEALASRRIVTGEHCFGCTAGCGSSCAGALD
jgi:radical SAM/Cys-rich protein